MAKYQEHIRFIISTSLMILASKVFIELLYLIIFVKNKLFVANAFIPLILVLAIGQLYGIKNKKKFTWILSLIQIILIYFTSESTFGWLIGYLFKPFSLYQPYYIYFISICLVILEILKTIWLYRKLT